VTSAITPTPIPTAINTQSGLAPRIAIVIPVYKHSVLVGEAICCALQQQTEFPIAVVIVNDGCPFAETDRIGREFATAYPDRVIYLARPNGGLSAARNTGINFALTTWASVEAIYLLDADNRITPHTIDRAFRVLQEQPEVGWVYPSIHMFGHEDSGNYRGDYSVLRHLHFNTCEAGSMVRRSVFEAGCRYDESMRLGFEDWEFWWQAIEAGFRGQHLPEFGFQYRKRPESMLRDSERDRSGIIDYMRRKHRRLFTHQAILSLEHQEAPRYAIFLKDTGTIVLTADPAQLDRTISLPDYQARYGCGFIGATWHHRAPFLVFTRQAVLQFLQNQKLLHWAFWRLEQAQADFNLATLRLERESAPEIRITEYLDTDHPVIGETDHLVMTTTRLLDACLRDSSDEWIQSLMTSQPKPKLFNLKLTGSDPEDLGSLRGGALYELLATLKDLQRQSRTWQSQSKWNWQTNYFPPRSETYRDAQYALQCQTIYPKLTQPQQRHLGFILPIVEFGGVEKVALNIARVFREQGWQVHLFVFNTYMQELPEWADGFDTINFLNEPAMYQWGGSRYLGSTYDNWSEQGDHQQVLGMMTWLDAVINFHSVAANGLMGLLRRHGVKTIASLHVHDLTPWNRSNGFSHLALGYEHAYDFLIPCSHQMARWCHAMGVPQDKIVVVPNACGYPLDPAITAALLSERWQRPLKRPLRVLFIGRFDRQKGLDRLVDIVTTAQNRSLPIEWRLVGKNIVKDQDAASELAPVAALIEPPALTEEALNQAYAWADVLLLPSYWEGLPLTVLEAMRLGVIVCASEVGAVSEAIESGQTGIIIPNVTGHFFTEAVLTALTKLIAQPDHRLKIQQAAAAAAAERSWQQACQTLHDRLHRSIQPSLPAGLSSSPS
jgi:glycosyltransferase involved in cell wall biosynthesis